MVRCVSCGYEWLAQPSLVLDQAAAESGAAAAAPVALTRDLVERLRPKQRVKPELSPAALIRARQLEHERKLRLIRSGIAWGAAAGVLLCIIGGGALFRNQLGEVWPKSASFFEALGLEVNSSGLSIEGLTVDPAPGPTPDVALVRGVVRNLRKDTQQAPLIRLALLDRRGEELAVAVAYPLQPVVRGAGLTTFEARFEKPPSGAVLLAARFAPVGSVAAHAGPQSNLQENEAEALQKLLRDGPPAADSSEPALPEPDAR